MTALGNTVGIAYRNVVSRRPLLFGSIFDALSIAVKPLIVYKEISHAQTGLKPIHLSTLRQEIRWEACQGQISEGCASRNLISDIPSKLHTFSACKSHTQTEGRIKGWRVSKNRIDNRLRPFNPPRNIVKFTTEVSQQLWHRKATERK